MLRTLLFAAAAPVAVPVEAATRLEKKGPAPHAGADR